MCATPSYYKDEQAGQVYVERFWEVAASARRLRELREVKPASEDKVRVAAFGIDCQVDFCSPQGALYVKNAEADTQRTLRWFYRNFSRITSLTFSLDTHHTHQIFHPSWWQDTSGRPPEPFTVIRAEEVASGHWVATQEPEASLAYCRALEAQEKYVLTIWPYHCIQGTVGHALMPVLGEAALFHSLARQTSTHFERKGQESMTESYSVFSPEVTELGGRELGSFREDLLSRLLQHDRIYVFGQASSHCVRATLLDIKDHLIQRDASLLQRFYILKDAMSPIPPPALHPLPASLNFPALAEQAFQELAQAGMHVTDTTVDIDL